VKTFGLATLLTLTSLTSSFSDSSRKGDFYFMAGKGQATQEGGDTRFYLETGFRRNITDRFLVGMEYINEGHPEIKSTGHRDGIVAAGWYRQPLIGRLALEFGVGPYFSMNTTKSPDLQKESNNENIGLFTSIASVFSLDSSDSVNFRTQLTEILMPGSFNTTALNFGLAFNLDSTERFIQDRDYKNSLAFLAGKAHTTRTNQKQDFYYQLELERLVSEVFSLSLSGISESQTQDGISSRKGIASQLWFSAPKFKRLEISAGAGPYIAQESSEQSQKDNYQGTKLLGIASLRFKLDLSENGWFTQAEISRIISSYDADKDVACLGIGKKF